MAACFTLNFLSHSGLSAKFLSFLNKLEEWKVCISFTKIKFVYLEKIKILDEYALYLASKPMTHCTVYQTQFSHKFHDCYLNYSSRVLSRAEINIKQ